MRVYSLFLIFCVSLFVSCNWRLSDTEPDEILGLRPVYGNRDSLKLITISGPQPTGTSGKIYVYGQFLFQNEFNKGFHVVNIADPKNPVKEAFYSIPLSTEISIKDNHLYTNNGSDLIVISIANYMNPVVVKRIQNKFPLVNQEFPNESHVHFECPDPSKGYIKYWERANLKNPKCRKRR